VSESSAGARTGRIGYFGKVIKYIGSKRRMVPRIVALAQGVPGAARVLDLFTGTTRVAQGLKAAGFHVTANDLASYSEVLATTYIATDARAVDADALREMIATVNALPGERGYFTRTFCEEARYLQPQNGARVDAIRAWIERASLNATERSILLTSLLEAADRVDSTTGLQMAYLKGWSARSNRALELRLPALLPGEGAAVRGDAREVVRGAAAGAYDLAYLDPPYNQHSYFNNYHVWETLVRGDAPPAYGIARKREDCRTTRSPFNSRPAAWDALRAVVYDLRARHVIVSFSDEGFLKLDAIQQLLKERFGEVAAIPVPTRRYVGAQIGIHDLRGVAVGEVSHLHNTEWLFLAGPDAWQIAESVEGAKEADAAKEEVA
jgi:adenine-specific DNA-methyltransferase